MDKIVWLVLMIVFLMVEASAVTLVSIWFGVGALAALISALFGAELWLQIVLFFAVSILALASLRPLLRKYFVPKLTPTNVDSVIGSVGLVIADIDNITAQGQVKLGGMGQKTNKSRTIIIGYAVFLPVKRRSSIRSLPCGSSFLDLLTF